MSLNTKIATALTSDIAAIQEERRRRSEKRAAHTHESANGLVVPTSPHTIESPQDDMDTKADEKEHPLVRRHLIPFFVGSLYLVDVKSRHLTPKKKITFLLSAQTGEIIFAKERDVNPSTLKSIKRNATALLSSRLLFVSANIAVLVLVKVCAAWKRFYSKISH